MAYTKTTWADGDIITAAKFNKMENGIETGQDVFWVNCTVVPNTTATNGNVSSVNYTADKTAEDVYNAAVAGKIVLYKVEHQNVDQCYFIFPLNHYWHSENDDAYETDAYMVEFRDIGVDPVANSLHQHKDDTDEYLVFSTIHLSTVGAPT